MYPQSSTDRTKLKLTESPRLRRAWASRTRRRLYTLLYGGFVAAGAVVLTTVDLMADLSGGRGLLLAVLGLTILVGGMFLVTQMNRATRMSLPYRLLDERQRTDRDTAFRISQQTMNVFLMVVFIAIAFITTFSPPDVVFPVWLAMPLLWVLVMLHISAPACYLAWTQPDEVLDEEDRVVTGKRAGTRKGSEKATGQNGSRKRRCTPRHGNVLVLTCGRGRC